MEASHDFVATNLPIGRFLLQSQPPITQAYGRQACQPFPLDSRSMTNKKNVTLRFRASADDQKQIEAKAQLAGLTVSEYMRRAATGQPVTERLPAELRQIIVGVANNLNQLTRYAHLRQFDDKAINEILHQLKTALR